MPPSVRPYHYAHAVSVTPEPAFVCIAGLAAYMRAGVTSIIADTASVSKTALASAASVFKRRNSSDPSQPTSPSQHHASSPTSQGADFDLQYLGPDKFAEAQRLKQGLPASTAAVDSDTALDNGKESLSSVMYGSADTHPGALQSTVPGAEVTASQDSVRPVNAIMAEPVCGSTEGRCMAEMVMHDGRSMPAHEVARSMFESVLIERGLAKPNSAAFSQSLPQLMGMTPPSAAPQLGSQPRRQSQAASGTQRSLSSQLSIAGTARDSSCEQAAAAGSSDVPTEPSAAGTADKSDDVEAGALAHSVAEPSTAGTAGGGESGEQWAGSQSPSQMTATALTTAAENEAAAQQPGVSSFQKLEEGFGEPEAETRGLSLDAGLSIASVLLPPTASCSNHCHACQSDSCGASSPLHSFPQTQVYTIGSLSGCKGMEIPRLPCWVPCNVAVQDILHDAMLHSIKVCMSRHAARVHYTELWLIVPGTCQSYRLLSQMRQVHRSMQGS